LIFIINRLAELVTERRELRAEPEAVPAPAAVTVEPAEATAGLVPSSSSSSGHGDSRGRAKQQSRKQQRSLYPGGSNDSGGSCDSGQGKSNGEQKWQRQWGIAEVERKQERAEN
jgi:hypothetical protein